MRCTRSSVQPFVLYDLTVEGQFYDAHIQQDINGPRCSNSD